MKKLLLLFKSIHNKPYLPYQAFIGVPVLFILISFTPTPYQSIQLLMLMIYSIFLTVKLFKSYRKWVGIIFIITIWGIPLIFFSIIIILAIHIDGSLGPLYQEGEWEEKYSIEYNIPKEKIIHAAYFTMADDSLKTFVIDISGSQYIDFIPKGMMIIDKNKVSGSLEGSALFATCENKELSTNIRDVICGDKIPENALIYQQDITDYDKYDIEQENLTYVVFPGNNLIWVSEFHW